MRALVVCLWVLVGCVSDPVRTAGDDVLRCPTLGVRAWSVRNVCNDSTVVSGRTYVAGMLVGRPGAAPAGGHVEVRYAGELVGRTQAHANGTFVVDYLIDDEKVKGGRRLHLLVEGRPRRKLGLPPRGARFHYRIDADGTIEPPPPISRDGWLEVPLDYRGTRGGTLHALNARTGAYSERPDDEARMRVVLEGLPGDDVIVVVDGPYGNVGGCYADIERFGGGTDPWKPSCWCTADERQRGECDAPESFPGEARVTVEDVPPPDAGTFDPDAALE
ncbi:MAG: hypothetical protein H6721_12325 [Sandaracinus sp.]|nr:hypothetical protein [Sandaracinus sp.]